MKILLFGNAKLKFMPYIHFYLENMDVRQHEVHVIYWNRDLKEEAIPFSPEIRLHEFRYFQNDQCPKVKKIRSYLKLRRFALEVMKQEKFDYIVALDSLPAVLIGDRLAKEFRGRYLFDYRDSSYEWFPPFRRAIGRAAENAQAVFVSSDGFREFFPDSCREKLYTTHNILLDSLNHREDRGRMTRETDAIRLAYWGFVRDENLNLELVKRLAGDSRFQLHFYGKEEEVAQRLKAYVREQGIDNVFFHGEYRPEDRYEMILHTDLLHNLYDNPNAMRAMGNKYYDGILFRIPQLCIPGSLMGRLVQEHGVGLVCSPMDADFADRVADYYETLPREEFAAACDRETDRVLQEYRQDCAVLQAIFSENGTREYGR